MQGSYRIKEYTCLDTEIPHEANIAAVLSRQNNDGSYILTKITSQ